MDDLDVNERPAVDSAIADQTMTAGVFRIISLQGTFSDPDTGDTLSYSASSSNTGIATASVNGSTLTLEALSAGSATITVTAADRSSGDVDRMTVEQDFMVIVEARSPNQPKGLKADNMIGGRGVELEWDPADGAAGYEVEISPTASAHEIDITGLTAEITGLTPGTIYTFKVLACNPCGASGLYSLPSIPIDFEAPEPTNSGHQADHTVEYMVPTPIGNSVISGAIEPAVSAWNFAITRLGKGLNICADTDTNCVNPDGFTVTIKTVDNNNDAIDAIGLDDGCGSARACVKSVPNGDHKENLYMIFEDPPWSAFFVTDGVWRFREYVWTKDKFKNGKLLPCLAAATTCAARYYVYADRIMLHEFGHTLGLSDFYNDDETDLDTLPNAVMHTGFVLTGEDLKQLEAIYLLHDPH